MSAADEIGAPVIMQASAGARKYAGESFLRHLIEAAVEASSPYPAGNASRFVEVLQYVWQLLKVALLV
jgi:hypothetical protein